MTVRAVRAGAVAAALVALLALVALASRGGRPVAGGAVDPAALGQVRDVVLTLAITLYVLFIVVFIWALRKFGSRDIGPGGSPVRGLIAFFAFVGILWVGLYTSDVRPIQNVEEFVFGEAQEAEDGGRVPGREGARKPAPPPAQFEWEVALVVIGAAAAVTVFLLIRLRPTLPSVGQSPVSEGMAGDLVTVIEGTLEELRGEADPRRAVIAAYAQMEHTLGRHGTPRRASEAPFEYLARVLHELRVRAPAVLALTELFERARFSLHTIDERMKDEAIDALAAVRDDLRAVT